MQIPLLASDTTDNDNKRKLSCIISKKKFKSQLNIKTSPLICFVNEWPGVHNRSNI